MDDSSSTGDLDLDRISALPDDLLHAILAFVGDAQTVTSTAVLSRRWRRVWTHAKHLAFTDSLEKYAAPGHFAGFVDWALAQRGDAGLESLRIRISRTRTGSTSPQQVTEWLRYAGRRVAGSLDVQIWASPADQRHAVELPNHCRATSISLVLAKHRLRLPAAARYESLTELLLFAPAFADEGALGDLVTSCCPRLRRLLVKHPTGLRQLVLRSESLEKLELTYAFDLRTLDVTAPNLRAASLSLCFHEYHPMLAAGDKKVARIAAPRLKEIGVHLCTHHARPPAELDIRGLASVRRLTKVWLDMHGKYCRDTDVGLWLLNKYPRAEHVGVWLHHNEGVADDGGFLDVAAEGAPPFANVRSMDITAWTIPACDLVASVSSLLTRCPRLRSLRAKVNNVQGTWQRKCFCDALADKCSINVKLRLETLEEVDITGFTGAAEEMQLVSLLFESSDSIKRMTLHGRIKRKPITISLKRKRGEERGGGGDDDADDTVKEQLMKIPGTGRGCWHFAKEVFTWMNASSMQ